MKRITKTKFVRQWWSEVVFNESQLFSLLDTQSDSDVVFVAPKRGGLSGWKNKITTNLLWSAFERWLLTTHPLYVENFNKTSFMTIFYGVSKGATRAVMRIERARVQAVLFQKCKRDSE